MYNLHHTYAGSHALIFKIRAIRENAGQCVAYTAVWWHTRVRAAAFTTNRPLVRSLAVDLEQCCKRPPSSRCCSILVQPSRVPGSLQSRSRLLGKRAAGFGPSSWSDKVRWGSYPLGNRKSRPRNCGVLLIALAGGICCWPVSPSRILHDVARSIYLPIIIYTHFG